MQPLTSRRRLNHICLPFRQLSMSFARLPTSCIFMPRTITEDDLLRIYSPDLPRELKFGLDQILVNRELDLTWHAKMKHCCNN